MVAVIGATVLVLWLVGGFVVWSWCVAAGMQSDLAEKPSRTQPEITRAA